MNYTEIEAKVREATNDDAWGPTGKLFAFVTLLLNLLYLYKLHIEMKFYRCTYAGNSTRNIYI